MQAERIKRGIRRIGILPRHRRWSRFLGDLGLDPGRLAKPVTPPGARDFIICGAPRSGTTLLAAALFQPPKAITVMEPWDGLRLPPAELFASLRDEIATTGFLSRGRLDVDALYSAGEVRWMSEGERSFPVETDGEFVLGVKWPAFWRYVELLPDTRFLVCIRDPVEVVTSCRKKGGAVAEGLDYECAFNAQMNAELRGSSSDAAIRRIRLYDYINGGLLPYLDRPNAYVVRYERWFTEREQMMREIADFLGTDLGSGRPQIRPRRELVDADPEEIALIAAHCLTGPLLGYKQLATA